MGFSTTVNVLKDITGLDNNTIEKMWNDKSLTKVNVVSACLGLHLPFSVSSTLVEAADLTINMFVGSVNAKAENRSYQGLLSTRWASEYDDIYGDLKDERMEALIKTPPKAKTSKKKCQRIADCEICI